MNGQLLDVSAATVRFGGVAAIEDLTFRHEDGGIIGLIGPNGAGKTTLLNVLSGAIPLTSGRVSLGDVDLGRRRADQIARAGVSRTFQNLQVFGSLSVLDNVLLPRIARRWGPALAGALGIPSARMRIAAERRTAQVLLEEAGVAEYSEERAGTLAYGLQRRVEIARALAGDPDLVLLDEPLAGLSRAESTSLTALFTKIARRGVTVLLVEHDVASVFAVSQRVLVLDHGRMLADGTPEQVAADTAVQAAYLGEGWA